MTILQPSCAPSIRRYAGRVCRSARRELLCTSSVPPHATLLAFTDGPFERRGESIDAGLERRAGQRGSLEALLTELVEAQASDDMAILGVRWMR